MSGTGLPSAMVAERESAASWKATQSSGEAQPGGMGEPACVPRTVGRRKYGGYEWRNA